MPIKHLGNYAITTPMEINVNIDIKLSKLPDGRYYKKNRKIKPDGSKIMLGRDHDTAVASYRQMLMESNKELDAPKRVAGLMPLENMADEYLQFQHSRLATNAIKPRTFDEYTKVIQNFIDWAGSMKAVCDCKQEFFSSYRRFMIADKEWSTKTVNKNITYVRSLFTWIYDTYIENQRPPFGPEFKVTRIGAYQEEQAERKAKLFPASDIRRLLAYSTPDFRLMILLGLNCGFGPTDCAMLPYDVACKMIDPKEPDYGFMKWRREKGCAPRESALWPETIEAMRTWLEFRPDPIDGCDCFLVRPDGSFWLDGMKEYHIGNRMKSVKSFANITEGTFAWFRHTMNTIGDSVGDDSAIKLSMGHSAGKVGSRYKHRIGVRFIADERLIAVASKVRSYVFDTDEPRDIIKMA